MGTLFIGTTHCLNKVNIPITCGHLTAILPPGYLSYTTNSPQQELVFKLQQLSRLLKGRSSGELAQSERFWWRAKLFLTKLFTSPRAPHINLSSI